MSNQVSVVLVGIGGYGNNYVRALLDHEDDQRFHITGVVDPYPEGCDRYHELKQKKIPIYVELEEFYAEHAADLAVISSPIQFHHEHSCLALAKGSHVLCEKPVSARIQEAMDMQRAKEEAGKNLAIGYQWSYSRAVQELKSDILQGKWGRPLRLKTLVLWPRAAEYYRRAWAGRRQDPSGRWVLDSVANNATAHYLHNMLYVLGDKIGSAARPGYIEGQLYAANEIENFDTAMLRVVTDNDVELLFYTTHAVKEQLDPTFLFEFTGGTIHYGLSEDGKHVPRIVGRSRDGTLIDYGGPNAEQMRHLWLMIESIIEGKELDICGVWAASSHTICINGIQEAIPDIPHFPPEFLQYDAERELTWVNGLAEVMQGAYHDWRLPVERDAAWVSRNRGWPLSNYTHFAGRRKSR
ncbi:MAG: Gfo/Idh/MocA family oxidoreductase [Firmicutes bacterium]|nr:Gfo/Idh/MocA family oxidoreductase [Bacillota bacterium]